GSSCDSALCQRLTLHPTGGVPPTDGRRTTNAKRNPPRLTTFTDDDLRRDPQELPRVLRAARPPAPSLGLPRPGLVRPVSAAHDRRDATAEAVLPRPGAASPQPPHELPEVLSQRRYRHHRDDHASPDVLRDARQLLDRRLLQGRGGRVRVDRVARGL